MLDELCYNVLKRMNEKGRVDDREFADIINCPVDEIRNHEGYNYLHHLGMIDFYDGKLGLTIPGRKALHDYETEDALLELQRANLDVQRKLMRCQYLVAGLTAISVVASLIAYSR